jgi:hypothetical protein
VSLLSDLYTYLSGKQQLTDLLGTGDEIRLWPGHIPQRRESPAFPYCIFRLVSDVSEHDIDRASGVSEARVEFASFSNDMEEANAVSEALRLCLDGAGPTDWGPTEIHSVIKSNEIHLSNPPADSSDDWLEQVSTDYQIRYEQSVPQFN